MAVKSSKTNTMINGRGYGDRYPKGWREWTDDIRGPIGPFKYGHKGV